MKLILPNSILCRSLLLPVAVTILIIMSCFALANPTENAAKSKILVHFMPWFEGNTKTGFWGWHWTMNAFDPNTTNNGKRQIASHYHPVIGPYDSGDIDVIEYQLLTMKIAGIDGVIVDWYGLQNFRDYAMLHRNTLRLIDKAEELNLSVAICYEDQTVTALVNEKKFAITNRIDHVADELKWMADNWFSKNNYVKVDGAPLLLSFGNDGLSDDEWASVFKQSPIHVTYLSEHRKRSSAVGAFDWPIPKEGSAAQDRFLKESKSWKNAIPVAFPRFVDIYAEAKVHQSWGRIDDNDGKTFQSTLRIAIQSKQPLIQIATWNDWSEGTMIEPSVEYGYRDLEVVQNVRRELIDSDFKFDRNDLRLPEQLFTLRNDEKTVAKNRQVLDRIATEISDGKLSEARKTIDETTSNR